MTVGYSGLNSSRGTFHDNCIDEAKNNRSNLQQFQLGKGCQAPVNPVVCRRPIVIQCRRCIDKHATTSNSFTYSVTT